MTDLEEPVSGAVNISDTALAATQADLDKVALPPSIWDMFETDEAAEEEGRWFNNVMGPGNDVKIRRMTSKVVALGRQEIDKRFRKLAKADGSYDETTSLRVVCEQIGRYMIADWRGPAFRNKDNTPMPYSPEAAIEVMMKLKDPRIIVLTISQDMDNYRIQSQEDAIKN